MMLSLIIKIKDIHHCKETDHVCAIVRTGHGQATGHMVHTGDLVPAGTMLVTQV